MEKKNQQQHQNYRRFAMKTRVFIANRDDNRRATDPRWLINEQYIIGRHITQKSGLRVYYLMRGYDKPETAEWLPNVFYREELSEVPKDLLNKIPESSNPPKQPVISKKKFEALDKPETLQHGQRPKIIYSKENPRISQRVKK